jgi:hypothetical protein
VKRFLCKKTGKTVSLHPLFSHAKKRYYLPFVIDCICLLFEKLLTLSSTSKKCEVPRQTLADWKRNFSDCHTEAKRICFSLHTGPPEHLVQKLFSCFRNNENADIYKGAATGMVRLHSDFKAALY